MLRNVRSATLQRNVKIVCGSCRRSYVASGNAATRPRVSRRRGRETKASGLTHTHTHTDVHEQENVSFGRIRKSGKAAKMTTEICDAVQICESDRLFGVEEGAGAEVWICVEALELALWFMLRIIVSCSSSPSRGCCSKDAAGFFLCCRWVCFFCRRVDKESETLLDLSLAGSVPTCSGHLHLSLPRLKAASCDVCSCIMSAPSLLWFIFRCIQLRIVIHLWQQPHRHTRGMPPILAEHSSASLAPPDKGLPRFSLIRLSSVSLPLPLPGAVINSLGHILFADCVVVFYHASEIRMSNEGERERK